PPALAHGSCPFSLANVFRIDYLAFPASNLTFPASHCDASDLESFSLQCKYLSANEGMGERWIIAHYVRYICFLHPVLQPPSFGVLLRSASLHRRAVPPTHHPLLWANAMRPSALFTGRISIFASSSFPITCSSSCGVHPQGLGDELIS